jgi:hypothetical protein
MRAIAAPKWCKALQDTEKRILSARLAALFHKLINTCVENFTKLKYFRSNSASLVLARKIFLTSREYQ